MLRNMGATHKPATFSLSFREAFQRWCNTWSSTGMKVIRHAGVDSRMIILDDQARQWRA